MDYKFTKVKDSEISTNTLVFNQCFDDEKGNADIIVELYDENYETYGDGFFVCKYNYDVDVDTSHYVGEDLKDEYKIKPEDCKINDVDIISVEMVDFNEDNKSYIENGNKMKDILLKDKEFAKSILKDYCMDYIVKEAQRKRDNHFSRDSKPVKDDKWEDQADKYEQELYDRINALNENSTLKDVCRIHISIDEFSDVYKDAYGFRPREKCSKFYRLLEEKCPKQFKEQYKNMDYDAIYEETQKGEEKQIYVTSFYDNKYRGVQSWYPVKESQLVEYIWDKLQHGFYVEVKGKRFSPDEIEEPEDINIQDIFIEDSKPVNDVIIKYISELELSLKSANTYASQLAKQIPGQKPTTNEEKELYNGNYVKTFETISDNIQHWYKELEEYKKKLSTAHVVAEEILEEFPLKARNELRNSTNIDETYKSLVEDLKNRYNSMEDKEKYKQQVLKMKKDLDGFYKSFKK